MGLVRRVAAAIVALVFVLASGVVPALAASPDGTVTLDYEFSADEFRTSLDGTVEPFVVTRPEPERILLTCGEDDCAFETPWGGVAVTQADLAAAGAGASFAVPGALTLSGAGSGSVCDVDTLRPPWEVHLEFTDDGVTGYARNEPTTADCPEGTLTSVGLSSEITTSSLVAGDCWFTDDGCFEDAAATPTAIAEPTEDPQPAGSSTSSLATGSPAAPSVLSALATPAQAGTAPSQLLLAVVLTIILVLLIAFPTALLNSAAEEGTGRLSAWWAGRRERRATPDPAAAPSVERSATPRSQAWWFAAIGVAAASVISSFVDPEFGFNAGSARVVLSIMVSFGVDVVLGWTLLIWLMRRLAPGGAHSYLFRPLSLLIVVLAVLFTRITGFEPGIVFGLVAGVAFAALAGRAAEARAALVPLGYGFGIALVAWLLYGALGGGAAAGESFWGTFAVETLASIAIGGMAALPIALFPVPGLPGHAVFSWSRWAWAGCYALGLFAFFIVLMPMPFSWQGVTWDLWAWIAVYLAYAAFAVIAWLVIARPSRHEVTAEDARDRAAVGASDNGGA